MRFGILQPLSGCRYEGKKGVVKMSLPDVEVNEGFMVIDDYDVIFAGSPEALRVLVIERVEEGWTVCGGVAIAAGGHRLSYAQAVVKAMPPVRIVQ